MNAGLPRPRFRWFTGRPAILLARFSILVVAGYLSQVGSVILTGKDRWVLGIEGLDARVLFTVATVIGVAYAFEYRVTALRWAWLVALTIAAWGRFLALILIGADYLTGPQELAAAVSWLIIFLAGLLATAILTASQILDLDR